MNMFSSAPHDSINPSSVCCCDNFRKTDFTDLLLLKYGLLISLLILKISKVTILWGIYGYSESSKTLKPAAIGGSYLPFVKMKIVLQGVTHAKRVSNVRTTPHPVASPAAQTSDSEASSNMCSHVRTTTRSFPTGLFHPSLIHPGTFPLRSMYSTYFLPRSFPHRSFPP